jgi:ABC-2 type transport system ATP-binding protein
MYSMSIENVTKRFGSKTAVDSITLEIEPGAFFGFLGPNGAGKSTTIKMIAGLLAPDTGRILLHGKEARAHEHAWKRRIGLLSDDAGFFQRLTLLEHLTFMGRLYGLSYGETAKRAEELLRFLDAWDEKDTIGLEASGGTKKKLSLALALVHNPDILLLDEPFEGIDFYSSRKIRQLLLALSKRGKTIFLTSHILEIVEQLIDSFAIIASGRIALRSTPAELAESNRTLADAYAALAGGEEPGAEPELLWLT